MKIRKPDYYDRFQCIAGKCSDSCCIGWEIDVDEERQNAYRNVSGELGERLRTCINWEEGHFILQGEEERCPFLNKENLCDLIIGLGEESLCDICREHPRYYEWYDGLTEAGVGLCCEAAARLVLEREEPAGFVVAEEEDLDNLDNTDDLGNEDSNYDSNEDLDTRNVLFEARDTAFAILQNRKKSVWQRLTDFLSYIDELQDALDFGNLDEIEESSEYYRGTVCSELKMAEEEQLGEIELEAEILEQSEISLVDKSAAYTEIIYICRELEPIDGSWPERLEEIRSMLSNPKEFCRLDAAMLEASKARDYEYEHLAVYFVYRYFMKCRNDGDIYSRGCLVVFCILLIRLLDIVQFKKTGTISKEDRVQNAKDCSKEIEYSEENLERLAEFFWERGFSKISVGL